MFVFPGVFAYFSKNEYDVVNKANPKMVVLFNQELDDIVSEYGSGMYAYIPEAPANLQKFYRNIKTVETYARYVSNSFMGYNGIRANLTFQDGRQIKDMYITSGGKFRSTRPKLLMRIAMQDGRATEVVTNGLELTQTPTDAKGTIRVLLQQLIMLDQNEHHNNYYAPPPPPPDPAKEWEKVQ
ncbi:MAG: hypothetical protein BGO31_01650 [Bacteroidetes bacterium 43-16]|nr:MAG: hypothetical protein BGO31_01650 [Bacteroidetes bacterium 43-16]